MALAMRLLGLVPSMAEEVERYRQYTFHNLVGDSKDLMLIERLVSSRNRVAILTGIHPIPPQARAHFMVYRHSYCQNIPIDPGVLGAEGIIGISRCTCAP